MKCEKVFIAALVLLSLASLLNGEEGSGDPVLDFYSSRAGAVTETRNPIERGATFSFDALTYHKRIGRGGRIELVDSTSSTYFYSFGKLDSVNTDTDVSSRDYTVDISYPNVFNHDYIFSFYPNDTGGSDLAIGFDTDTSAAPDPDGVAIIDRNRYFLKWLYLYYPQKQGYKRYSYSIRFMEQDNLVFPDSIWIIAAKPGFFSTEYTRTETAISNLKVEY